MADRRSDDAPIAPRRSLGGPEQRATESAGHRRPLSQRVAAAGRVAGGRVAGDRTASSTSSRAGTAQAGGSRNRPGTRKARLRLLHLDPWSVMKTSFLLSIAFGIVTVVAVGVVWSVLGAAGVWESINQTVGDVVGGDSAGSFAVQDYLGTSRVMGFTMIIAVLDVVLITAIATLSAFLYNLAATLLGGIEVTLAEEGR